MRCSFNGRLPSRACRRLACATYGAAGILLCAHHPFFQFLTDRLPTCCSRTLSDDKHVHYVQVSTYACAVTSLLMVAARILQLTVAAHEDLN